MSRRARTKRHWEALEVRRLLATVTVTNLNDTNNLADGVSIREAISAINAGADSGDVVAIGAYGTSDTINFNIGGGGLATIGLTADLPDIVKPLTINGYSQPGATANTLAVGDDAKILIEIDGNSFEILELAAGSGGSTIRGLSLYDADAHAITIESANNVFAGNFVGLRADGVTGGAAEHIPFEGVAIFNSDHNVIGGTAPADRNLISNAHYSGVYINSNGGVGLASFNRVEGNYIGTDRTGTLARPNIGDGVSIVVDANDNTIGGPTAAHRNIISGNVSGGGQDEGVRIIRGSTRNLVQGNYIGADVNGLLNLGNEGNGVEIDGAPENTIDKNVIGGNGENGVLITGGDSEKNAVTGNYIGLGADGAFFLSNGEAGVHIFDAPRNTVGGATAGARNVISYNVEQGVLIDDDTNTAETANNNRILGNYIGTDATGTLDRGNFTDGVLVNRAEDNFVGGSGSGEGNLISGNDESGVYALRINRITIQGNLIGTNAAGTAAIPNEDDGVALGVGGGYRVVGGVTPGARNVISGNLGRGIIASQASAIIQGNYIGTDITGALPLGNGEHGILIDEAFATIGGPIPAAGNVIAYNGKAGVALTFTGDSSIRLNSIHSNGGLGIDILDDGVTANDPGDADGGPALYPPNDLQNFPVLAFAQSNGSSTTIQGGLNTDPNRLYLIDFYANDVFDPSLNGEGKTYLGSVAVVTDFAGNAIYNPTFPTAVAPGKYISATATNVSVLNQQTSEFSQVVQVFAPPPPPPPPPAPSVSINDVCKAEGNAGTTAFTFTLTRTGDLSAGSIVSVSTADGSALAPSDYASQTGVLVAFAPNSPTASFTVNVNGDSNFEPDENFFVNVTSVTNATIGDGQGQGTVQNDDPPPSVSINDVSKSEGNGGVTAYTFTLTRTGDLSVQSVVSWSTADGSAAAPSDYALVAPTQVIFAPNQTTAQVTVNVNGDTTVETDETFFVNLTAVSNVAIGDGQGVGTIKNDDPEKCKIECVPDPCDSQKSALQITGTEGGDRIEVWYGGSGKYAVKIDGKSCGTFSCTGGVIVYGRGGNDLIGVDTKISRSAYILGGDGNDTCYGGGGSNVIVGGRGNDNCFGYSSRDICIGGEGADSLDAGSGDDLLVAGCTGSDDSLAELCKIQKEWCRTDKDYKTRCNNVRSGAGYCGGVKFCETTIADDAGIDTCKGGSGSDMFWSNQTGGTYKDKLSDKSSSETQCELV